MRRTALAWAWPARRDAVTELGAAQSTCILSVCQPLAPAGCGGDDSAGCKRPLPSELRTLITWFPGLALQAKRQGRHVMSEAGVLSCAGCQPPSSIRSSTLEMPRAPAKAYPPSATMPLSDRTPVAFPSAELPVARVDWV